MQAVDRQRTAFLIVSGLCLAAAFAWDLRWAPALVVLVVLGLLLTVPRSSQVLMSPGFLGGYVVVAAGGMYLGLSSILLVLGTCSALATWDLADLTQSSGPPEERKSWRAMARAHYGALAMALVIGLLLSLLASGMSLSLTFGLMVVLVVVFFVSTAAALHQFSHQT